MKYILIFIFLVCSSCQVYQSDFDSPVGKGIPNKSVSEIEKMIIETESGPDLFPAPIGRK